MSLEFIDRHRGFLTEAERSRAEALRLDRVRHEYLRTRLLQRFTLSRYANVDPSDWVFAGAPGHRPEIASPAEYSWLRFNLTHTSGLIACAVARDAAIGVDAERIDPLTDVEGVASRFFTPREAKALRRLDPDLRRVRFLQHWTLKEGCFKALGTGLTTAMDALQVTFEADASFTVCFSSALPFSASDWQFESRAPTSDHVLGLAIAKGRRPSFTTQLHWHEA